MPIGTGTWRVVSAAEFTKNWNEGAHRVEFPRAESAAVFQHLVEAFLHCRELIRLDEGFSGHPYESKRRKYTIGMSSSETGSLEDNSR